MPHTSDTWTSTAPCPGGLFAVICVSELTVTVTGVGPKSAAMPAAAGLHELNPVPVIVTEVPGGPLAGLMLVTVGVGPLYRTKNDPLSDWLWCIDDWPQGVVTVTLKIAASWEARTGAVMCVSDTTVTGEEVSVTPPDCRSTWMNDTVTGVAGEQLVKPVPVMSTVPGVLSGAEKGLTSVTVGGVGVGVGVGVGPPLEDEALAHTTQTWSTE